MKKIGILFYLILLVTITCSSQNILDGIGEETVSITTEQLKETNLIFVEHQKLLNENELLLKQVSNYKLSNELLVKSDSLKSLQIDNYNNIIKNIDSNKKSNSSLWQILGIGLSLLILIFK